MHGCNNIVVPVGNKVAKSMERRPSVLYSLIGDISIEDKIKLRYYKEVINPTLEDQKYLSVLTSSKKKINIAMIRTNSHELHSETGTKTLWVERIFHLCENMNIEDENHFLLECTP